MLRSSSCLLWLILLSAIGCGSSDGVGPNAEPRSLPALQPLCAEPAPLLGAPDPSASGYIVVFHPSVDASREAARLAAAHGFQPRHVYTAALGGFSADLSRDLVATLRCVPTIDSIEHNQVYTIGE